MIHSLIRACVTLLMLGSISCPPVQAAYMTLIEPVTLLPNTADQRIVIRYVSDAPLTDPAISGLELHVELGDGLGGLAEPVFTGIDFSSGVFGSVSFGGGIVSSAPSLIDAGVVSSANIAPSATARTLAELVVSTESFPATLVDQVFQIRLTSHQTPGLPDTQFLGPMGNATPLDPSPSFAFGSVRITAVPEPNLWLPVGPSVAVFALRRRNRWKSVCSRKTA